MKFECEEDRLNIDKVIEKFDFDCKIRTNIIVERNKFLQRKQYEEENIDQFVT